MYTTSHNDNSNLVFLQQRQKPSSSIADLRQRAHVNRADTETYSVKNWINTVIKLFEQVRSAIGLSTFCFFFLIVLCLRVTSSFSITILRVRMSRICVVAGTMCRTTGENLLK